jgi:hypothetical protein
LPFCRIPETGIIQPRCSRNNYGNTDKSEREICGRRKSEGIKTEEVFFGNRCASAQRFFRLLRMPYRNHSSPFLSEQTQILFDHRRRMCIFNDNSMDIVRRITIKTCSNKFRIDDLMDK